MDATRFNDNDAFDRLERRLLAMRVGDTLHPMDAADETGLAPETCRAVLLGLERAGLMTRENGDRFVRQSIVSSR